MHQYPMRQHRNVDTRKYDIRKPNMSISDIWIFEYANNRYIDIRDAKVLFANIP